MKLQSPTSNKLQSPAATQPRLSSSPPKCQSPPKRQSLSTPPKATPSPSLHSNGTQYHSPSKTPRPTDSLPEPLSDSGASPRLKKKKKKKRRHSEMEGETEPIRAPPVAAPAEPQQADLPSGTPKQVDPASENKKRKKKKRRVQDGGVTEMRKEEPAPESGGKKKKKKRRREEENGDGGVKRRECVQTHLETQEEEWGQGGAWSLSPAKPAPSPALPSTQAKVRKASLAPPLAQTEPRLTERAADATETLRKRKKKRKRKRQEQEEIMSTSSALQREKVKPSSKEDGETTEPKKKKKRRLKEEEGGRGNHDMNGDLEPETFTKNSSVENTKTNKDSTAPVIAWDFQIKDGYKRGLVPAADEKGVGEAVAASRMGHMTWDGKKSSSVVQELLKNATDKAYGAQVLSWEGGASTISRDAMEDARWAKTDTVIDEWDEEFDSGKVKKVKKLKREKWKSSGNIFQKIQDRKNMWSVTPGGKKSGFVTPGAKKSSLGFRR